MTTARHDSLDVEEDLHTYLQGAREALVWKLEGLGEYDIRRPLTPTGTNLLGLVKPSVGMELLYFGGLRPPARHVASVAGGAAEPKADFWAAPDEARDDIVCRLPAHLGVRRRNDQRGSH